MRDAVSTERVERVEPMPRDAARARVVWVAVAEGRGHLMRAQLAARLLAPAGIDVDVVTTARPGVAFAAGFGERATLLSESYRLIYDERQNLARLRTRAMALGYLALPARCWRDHAWLEGYAEGAALVVDDSFHPALLAASLVGTRLASRIVHVHGANTRKAVDDSAGRGPLRAMIRRALARSTRIEITLGERQGRPGDDVIELPPLLAAPRDRAVVRAELGVPANSRLAVVYLNPYFRDPSLAAALEAACAGYHVHAVGEGYARRPGWRARDPALADAVAAADLFVSAAGSGALALARATGVPMIAIATDQPEQRANLASVVDHGSWRRVVDLAGDVHAQLAAAVAAVPSTPPRDAGLEVRRARAAWLHALTALVNRQPKDRS